MRMGFSKQVTIMCSFDIIRCFIYFVNVVIGYLTHEYDHRYQEHFESRTIYLLRLNLLQIYWLRCICNLISNHRLQYRNVKDRFDGIQTLNHCYLVCPPSEHWQVYFPRLVTSIFRFWLFQHHFFIQHGGTEIHISIINEQDQ